MITLLLLTAQLLSLNLSVMRGFEPLDVKIRVTLIPSDSNRSICVGYANVDSGAESNSCRTLDGSHEPKTLWYEWKKLRAGRYVVFAQVVREAQKALEMSKQLEVLGTN